MKKTNSINLFRILFYLFGAAILAVGITFSTKTGLGVSPIISVPFVISRAAGLNFAAMTFVVYSILTGLQFLLKGKNRVWRDLLQLPFSLVFSFFLDIFGRFFTMSYRLLWQNLLLLLLAICLTGIGAAIMVNMKLIPNPADGLACTVGDVLHRGMGFGKNLIDVLSVVLSVTISLVFTGSLSGLGIGTILAMVGVGRVVAVFNHFCRERTDKLAGL